MLSISPAPVIRLGQQWMGQLMGTTSAVRIRPIYRAASLRMPCDTLLTSGRRPAEAHLPRIGRGPEHHRSHDGSGRRRALWKCRRSLAPGVTLGSCITGRVGVAWEQHTGLTGGRASDESS